MGAAAGTLTRGTTTVGGRHASRTVRGAKAGAAALAMWTVADAWVGRGGGLAHADGCGWLPPLASAIMAVGVRAVGPSGVRHRAP
ncbi:hypothetical protein BU14_3119s0001 [Porphyra umbilicalis]|uniref:Uncharacterized protein n=1 Tax=Porphyra umbilicalis TaxID=2786 RepID=A0A1X6NI21_PORUM|nr:hypothetical protein BU14_3119s0001 [Porphyra umbilicalis]|eukprot:OSX68265.1 hypothetical protein BU14_3119s0001 [Porphyra umbilicalis]